MTFTKNNSYIVTHFLLNAWIGNFFGVNRWLFMALLYCLVRLPVMFAPMWYDEIFTARLAQLPLSHWWHILQSDTHPPIGYLPQFLLMQMGLNHIFFLRLPSFLIGFLSIFIMFRLCLALGKSVYVAWIASAILIFLPPHIFYSTQARAYIILVCCVWLGMWAILQNRPIFLIFVGILPLLHAHGYIYALVLFVWVVWKQRLNWQRWLFWLLISTLLSTLWIPVVLQQAQIVANRFWLPNFGLGSILRYLLDMVINLQIDSGVALLLIVIVGTSMIWGIRQNRIWFRSSSGQLWVMIAIGIPVFVAIISIIWNNIFLFRYLLPSALIWVIVWADLAQQKRLWRYCGAVILGLVCIYFVYTPNNYRVNYANILAYCDKSAVIFTVSPQIAIIADYLSDKPIYLWNQGDDLNQYLTDNAKQVLQYRLVDSINEIKGDVCVVANDNPLMNARQADKLAEIVANQTPIYDFQYQDIRVAIFLKIDAQ